MVTEPERSEMMLTNSDFVKMHEMAMAIWGIDLYDVKTREYTGSHDGLLVPLLDDNFQVMAGSLERPKFEQELVTLDRWLIPWRVKAGYSQRLNLLVYRVVEVG
jgi:hypothetical protein